MLEDKMEKLKISIPHPSPLPIGEEEGGLRKINTIIDLNVEAYIPNDFFTSELDKLNFYREIESIRNLEDLENLVEGFKELVDDNQMINSEDVR
ncbi:MAG: hypothetical protein LBC61_02855 [Candidatus Peribacteria bacterium]|jgi:transcription-repair coupling factor (superfamily II helicase)|nr:hypothetical protein [Candidatus Peribacteria bacterium]